MARESRPIGGKKRKAVRAILQERVQGMFGSKEELPAAISIQQAEAMEARIRELEAQLGQPASTFTRISAGSASADVPGPARPAESSRADAGDIVSSKATSKQASTWIAIVFAVVGLAFIGLSQYIVYVIQHGVSDLSDKALFPVAIGMFLLSLLSLNRIRHNHIEAGIWILYLSNVIVPPVIVVLFLANVPALMIGYVAVISSVFVGLILPLKARRLGLAAAIGAGLAIAGIEAWNPAFRVTTGTIQEFTSLVVVVLLIAILAFAMSLARRPRLEARLTTMILLSTLPLLVAIAAFLSFLARGRMEAGAETELQGNSRGLASSIATWVDLNVSALQQLTTLPAIVSMDPDQQRPALLAMAEAYPYMYLVSTTDMSGRNVARNDEAALTDYSDRAWFQDARDGAPVAFQSLVGRTTGQPALVVSMPIRNPAGGIVGVGMFAADLTRLGEELQVSQIGQAGFTYLVDSNNQTLAHPDPTYTAELRDLSEYAPVVALRQGVTGLFSFTDEDGIGWRAHATLLDNGWAVIAQRPESEIVAPARQFQTVVLLMILVGGGVMLALAWLSIRRTVRPIELLTNTISAITAGDLSRVADVKSKDEIGTLAAAFNGMVGQLRTLIGSLERRVAERTHGLELASEVGRAVSGRTADLQGMLNEAVTLISAQFDLYHTQIYLADPTGRSLILRAGTGEVGVELIRRGHQLAIGLGSLNGRAAAEKQAVIVADAASSPDFLPNPLLPETRSEMAVPLLAAGHVVGVLDMQSSRPGALNETNLPAFEILAAQLAIAIQNAALFAEAGQARAEVEDQVRRLTQEGWQGFMDAVRRKEVLGFAFDQTQAVQLEKEHLATDPAPGSLNVPLKVSGAEVGAIQVAGEEGHSWSSEETELVRAAASQLAQHLENLRLLAQAEQYRTEAEQAVRRLTREGWEAYSQVRQEPASGYRYDLHEVQPLSGKKSGSGPDGGLQRPLVVNDEVIGELTVEADASQSDANALVAAVAEQLSSHLENLRLSEQNEKRAQEMETVAEVGATSAALLDPDALLQTVVDLTKARFGVYHVQVYLADQPWQMLLLAAGAGEVGRQLVAAQHTIPLTTEKSLVARAAREREPVIVDDVRGDPGFLPNPLLPETRSEMAVPMIVGDRVVGVFDVQADRLAGFSKDDASTYSTLASQVAVALQNSRLYAEQAASVTQLRELDRLKTSFLANMSHELRTPLNSILGFADVILNELDGPLTENMSTDLQLIHKNGQHLLSLINNVLDMAKIEAGKMSLTLEKFKLGDVLSDVVSLSLPMVNEKVLSLYVEEDSDEDTEVEADRIRIRQVMLNLVGNAIKFTEKGEISVRTDRAGDHMRIRVRDTGVGIPPDQQERIFQEFTQVDSSATRKVGGTGLGLPISRRLVEMHGGRLWLESTGVAGEGATFFVDLPLVAKVPDSVDVEGK
jgi:signal transduction histidine kinase/HAMP domain-containing protein